MTITPIALVRHFNGAGRVGPDVVSLHEIAVGRIQMDSVAAKTMNVESQDLVSVGLDLKPDCRSRVASVNNDFGTERIGIPSETRLTVAVDHNDRGRIVQYWQSTER